MIHGGMVNDWNKLYSEAGRGADLVIICTGWYSNTHYFTKYLFLEHIRVLITHDVCMNILTSTFGVLNMHVLFASFYPCFPFTCHFFAIKLPY